MVELAGGVDVLGFAGERSRVVSWDEVAAARPDVVVAMPCGYDAERAAEETLPHAGELARARRAQRSWLSTPRRTSRGPGPRLVDGVELLAYLLHPDAGRAAAARPGRDRRRGLMAKRAEHSPRIEGTPRECFDALLDFESYPGWQRAVRQRRS